MVQFLPMMPRTISTGRSKCFLLFIRTQRLLVAFFYSTPMNISEVVINCMVFLTLVQVEGNSLHTISLSRDCTIRLILLPLSGERRVRVQALPVLILTRLTMTLCVSVNSLRSLVVEGNLIFIASRPSLVRSVDKELSIIFI